MKTAKEMFEELGYEVEIKDNVISYTKELILDFQHSNDNDFYNCLYIHNANKEDISFSKEELKSINQQISELKWE